MKKTVVINVVGLSDSLIGESTPFLKVWSAGISKAIINPVLPAVTCSVQSTYLTGKTPEAHGVVGNGWYFKDECEVKFWKQSNHLVQSEKIWDVLKKANPSFTCANMFWWFNMYSSVDYSVTPRPMYPADGRKLPDVYTNPSALRDQLQEELGTFPLFDFWGPRTTIRSSKWIADASIFVDRKYNPTLSLIYLPHLDYGLQKFGPGAECIKNDLKEIDAVCKDLIEFYEKQNATVILLSEYGISKVEKPVHINRVLRENNFIQVRNELGRELIDHGACTAFAVSDHQVAHIYVKDKSRLAEVKAVLEKIDGIEKVYDKAEIIGQGLNHDRSGDLVVVSNSDAWFTYYYWMDDDKAPDFARTVDIHRKPGYDPVEMFIDPEIQFVKGKVGLKLLKKKLGFRTLMDIIPLDAKLVNGSHGRVNVPDSEKPLLICNAQFQNNSSEINAVDVFSIIKDCVMKMG